MHIFLYEIFQKDSLEADQVYSNKRALTQVNRSQNESTRVYITKNRINMAKQNPNATYQ